MGKAMLPVRLVLEAVTLVVTETLCGSKRKFDKVLFNFIFEFSFMNN